MPAPEAASFRPASRRAVIRFSAALAAACAAAALPGCVQTMPRRVRIGLVAPFEGRSREVGYDVIPAVRLAIRQWAVISAGMRPPGIAVELVAYDDRGEAGPAEEQARKLAADPEVALVLGHWLDGPTRAALPVYVDAGLPLITFGDVPPHTGDVTEFMPSTAALTDAARAWLDDQGLAGQILVEPPGDVLEQAAYARQIAAGTDEILIGGPGWGWGQFAALTEGAAEGLHFVTGFALPADTAEAAAAPERIAAFVEDYTASNLGQPPGPLAWSASQAAWLAITRVAGIDRGALPADLVPGLSTLAFDSSGQRISPPIYLYRWQGGQRALVSILAG